MKKPTFLKITKLYLILSITFIFIVLISSILKNSNSNNDINDEKFKSGVYLSYYPNFTIEFNDNGNLFITPKKSNTFYCTRKGNWSINNSNVIIKITDKNNDIYCDWVENLEGIWEINENTITKGNYKLIKK